MKDIVSYTDLFRSSGSAVIAMLVIGGTAVTSRAQYAQHCASHVVKSEGQQQHDRLPSTE